MALKIRLTRIGTTHQPHYRVVSPAKGGDESPADPCSPQGRVDHQRVEFQCVGVAAHPTDPAHDGRVIDGREGESLGIVQEGHDLRLRLARRLVGWSGDGLAQDARRLAALNGGQRREVDDLHPVS